MLQRFLFLAITLFWLVMSYLLWKHEHFGARVPVATVSDRLLNPEEEINHFDIYLKGNMEEPIGSFTMSARSVDARGIPLTGDRTSQRVAGYNITLDGTPPETLGSVEMTEGQQVKFNLDIHFRANREWKYFQLTLGPAHPLGKPAPWNVTLVGDTTNEVVSFAMARQNQPAGEPLVKTFEELARWQSLLEIAGWVVEKTIGMDNNMYKEMARAAQLLGPPAGLPWKTPGQNGLGLGKFELAWEAHYGPLPDYSSRRQVYRLQAPLLGEGQRVEVYVDRAGDILRASIPGLQTKGIEIRNRRFYPLPTGP